MPKYLFVLSPPYSGSTVLWRMLATSPHVSAFEQEGQFLDSVRHVTKDPWNLQKPIPWEFVKEKWEEVWDCTKPILLEKSPPNLAHAFEIERVFSPAYFIIINRNPYAFCEGRVRRLQGTMAQAAQFWVRCSRLQMKNLSELTNAIHFTYETFTESLGQISQQILEFVPELHTLDAQASFKAQAVTGYDARPITNLNQLKIDLLSNKDLAEINSVLSQHPDVMQFWGYDYVYPSRARGIHYWKAFLSLHIKRRTAMIGRLLSLPNVGR